MHSHDRVPEVVSHVTNRLIANEAGVVDHDVYPAVLADRFCNGFFSFFYGAYRSVALSSGTANLLSNADGLLDVV